MTDVFAVESYIHYFDGEIDNGEKPAMLNNPFDVCHSNIALLAAEKLKQFIQTQKEWEHDFGLSGNREIQGAGKMFGVLVVELPSGELAYLQAFSGKMAGRVHLPGFVPPVFDMLEEDNFYRRGEQELVLITKEIERLGNNASLVELRKLREAFKQESVEAIGNAKEQFRLAKQERGNARKASDDVDMHKSLALQSINSQRDYKQVVHYWKNKIQQLDNELKYYLTDIEQKREFRRKKSAGLQTRLFENYNFYNNQMESRNLLELFKMKTPPIPPSGAGDCAAPKLLQFAFMHGLKPLSIAEFWWGKSPATEVRQHGTFYPACKGKCEPILAHMLEGVPYPERRVFKVSSSIKRLDVVFEDDSILVINKPHGLLSVPGKGKLESVYSLLRASHPALEGPIIVHRLDMDTSGIMLIAKSSESYYKIQQQFIHRTIEKRYVAILDGVLEQLEGEIDLPLRVDHYDRPRQLVCFESGKPSKTKWELLSVDKGTSRINLFPMTGRTHQLRVHCAHEAGLGISILGDMLYGKESNRLHLHAEEMSFMHPVSGEKVCYFVQSPF